MKLRACLGNGPFTASSDPRRKKKIANYPGHMAYPMSELSLGSALVFIGRQPWTSIFQFRRTKSRIQFDNTFWFISLL